MNASEHPYLHAFNTIEGIGSEKLHLLGAHFKNFKDAWEASRADLLTAGISAKITDQIIKERDSISPQSLWSDLTVKDIDIISFTEESYPDILKRSSKPPYLFYIRGSKTILNGPSVGIVGSRKHSAYGAQAATRLAYDLAHAGVHIISGLAIGIDGIAHKGALEAASTGKTIAVLGGGIDDESIAPRAHCGLAKNILKKGGALLSVYPPDTKPSAGTFPARNAIMMALSHAILVIEAGNNSGTLITATLATKSKKPLYAIPGSIFAKESVGTNALIAKNEAKLVQDASTILADLGISEDTHQKKKYTPRSLAEEKILETLSNNSAGVAIDKIIRETTLEGAVVSETLVIMEIDGIVGTLSGGLYILR